MRLLPLLLLTGLLPGCATLVEGTSQSMTVATTPAGASCTLDRNGERLGTVMPTPGSLRVDKSKNDVTVTCAKEGYRTATTSHSSKFVGTTFGNILAGGLVGVVVDAASGANFRYPNEVQVELAPIAPPVAGFGPAVMPYAVAPSDTAPVIATVPNPFRAEATIPGPVRGASRSMGQKTL